MLGLMTFSPFVSPVRILLDAIMIPTVLAIPPQARGIIVFCHDPQCSNRNTRNRVVARSLFRKGFAVLLPELSNAPSEADAGRGWGVDLDADEYAQRLLAVIDWIGANPSTAKMAIGIFGDRAAAVAAVTVAAQRPEAVKAVVTRGGSLEAFENFLPTLTAHTLLIVRDHDRAGVSFVRRYHEKSSRQRAFEMVVEDEGLFGDHGNNEHVNALCGQWFQKSLVNELPRSQGTGSMEFLERC